MMTSVPVPMFPMMPSVALAKTTHHRPLPRNVAGPNGDPITRPMTRQAQRAAWRASEKIARRVGLRGGK